jgi:hypothetical protein
MKKLLGNVVYELVPLSSLPKGTKVIKGRWVYRIKRNAQGQAISLEARWVAKGFSQTYLIDYKLVYAHVARSQSLRVILSLSCVYDLDLWHIDVNSAYLQSPLSETVYMEQPEGYSVPSPPGCLFVCRLLKAIPGLKQAARAWQALLAHTPFTGFFPMFFRSISVCSKHRRRTNYSRRSC